MTKRLTDLDFCRASTRLRCDVAAIKAVAEVESRQNGFDLKGRPVILFERHKFYKYASRRAEWTRLHPDICNKTPGGYGSTSIQYARFSRAYRLDPVAAMYSCSWGKFQIMGFNHAICGFRTIHAFVDAMKSGEPAQLDAFIEFVIHNSLDDELRRLDWAGFARGYNGAGYRQNNYDKKMAQAYARYKLEKIDCSRLSKAVTLAPVPVPDVTDEEIDVLLSEIGQNPPGLEEPASIPDPPTELPAIQEEGVQTPSFQSPLGHLPSIDALAAQAHKLEELSQTATKVSKNSWATTLLTQASGYGLVVLGFFQNNPMWAAIGIVAIGIAIYYLTQAKWRDVEKSKI